MSGSGACVAVTITNGRRVASVLFVRRSGGGVYAMLPWMNPVAPPPADGRKRSYYHLTYHQDGRAAYRMDDADDAAPYLQEQQLAPLDAFRGQHLLHYSMFSVADSAIDGMPLDDHAPSHGDPVIQLDNRVVTGFVDFYAWLIEPDTPLPDSSKPDNPRIGSHLVHETVPWILVAAYDAGPVPRILHPSQRPGA